MTKPDNDDLKRAEEIRDKLLWSYGNGVNYEENIHILAQALSEERARTLNSEAVQGLVRAAEDALESLKSEYGNMVAMTNFGLLVGAIKKFQQFKDGK